jgi:type I restriction enzyme M protein
MNEINISQLIKSTNKYDLTIFTPESIDRIEKSIFIKNGKAYIACLKRQKDFQAKPEEIVRQLMLDKLINEYGYDVNYLAVEYTVNFGREKKFADIVILNKVD